MSDEYGGGFVAVTSDPDGEGYFANDYDVTHCKHGTYVGYPGGADYMCHWCEMGYDPPPPPTEAELVEWAYQAPALDFSGISMDEIERAATKFGYRRIEHEGRVAWAKGEKAYRFVLIEEATPSDLPDHG